MKRIYWLTLYAVITHPGLTGDELKKGTAWLANYSAVGIEGMLGKLVKDGMVSDWIKNKGLVYKATPAGVQEIADIFLSLNI